MNATNQEPHQDKLVSFGRGTGAHAFPSLAQSEWTTTSEESAVRGRAEFAFFWEEEFARRLDEYEVSWRYKPRTFAVEWDEDGNFVDSFTPDFYLPDLALYVELAPSDDRDSGAKARKVRLLRQQQPDIRVEILSGPLLPRLLKSLCL